MSLTTDFDILAAIDLRGGRVVRLRQGDFTRETAFSDDPVAVAVGFVDAGARWLHVVDLDGARSGTPAHAAVITDIVSAVGERAAVEVGGGLRDDGSVAAALATGATRAVVGTSAIREPGFAARLVEVHGASSIAVAIDVRDGQAMGDGWVRDSTGVDAADVIGRLADAGVAAFEVTAIDRDGLLHGPDLHLYRRLVARWPGRIIASGGIGTIGDVRAVRRMGCAGAIVGRALYEGRLTIEGVLEATRRAG